MAYDEKDAVVFTRRVQGTAPTEGSVHRTCAGPDWGCKKPVWASRFSVKREAQIKAEGGQVWYLCMQCSAALREIKAAAGVPTELIAPDPAEWAEIEKDLAPFARVKLRLLHLALFGRLPTTGD